MSHRRALALATVVLAAAGLSGRASASAPSAEQQEEDLLFDLAAPPVAPAELNGTWTTLRVTVDLGTTAEVANWEEHGAVLRRWTITTSCPEGSCDAQITGAGADGSYLPSDVLPAEPEPASSTEPIDLTWEPGGEAVWTTSWDAEALDCWTPDGRLEGPYVGGVVTMDVRLLTDHYGRTILAAERAEANHLTAAGTAAGCDPANNFTSSVLVTGIRDDQFLFSSPTVWEGEWARSNLIITPTADAGSEWTFGAASDFAPTSFRGGCASAEACVVEQSTEFMSGIPATITYGGTPDGGLRGSTTYRSHCVDLDDGTVVQADAFAHNETLELHPLLVQSDGVVVTAMAQRTTDTELAPEGATGACAHVAPSAASSYELFVLT